MPNQSAYRTTEHEALVQEVLSSPCTSYIPKYGVYTTHYFRAYDKEHDYGNITSECIDIFTDKVRSAAATFLKRKTILGEIN